jgi:uncharacterized protein (TIGR03086 family)
MDTTGAGILDLHSEAVARTRRVVAGLSSQDWAIWIDTARTDVRRLVNHLAVESSWVQLLLAGHSVEEAKQRFPNAGDLLGSDAVAAYDRCTSAADGAFRSPGALEVACQTPPIGEVRTGYQYAGTRFVDLLIHGWEIAKVTGQDTRLDPDLASAAHEVIEPQIADLFDRGVIAKPLELPAEASPQDRFLALFGFSE